MTDLSAACVCIPTLNEAGAIGEVIDGFRDEGVKDILVVDGGSDDGTRDIAADRGVRVITQRGTGKGQAVRQALREIDKPYIVLVDGDATYDPEDVHDLIEPLAVGAADHVIANRFAGLQPGAMPPLNRAGNHIINTLFRGLHSVSYTDILSGYRAFTRNSIDRLALESDGFSIETELAIECARTGLRVESIPTTYKPRPNETEPKLNPFGDGARIIGTLLGRTKDTNPLLYFGVPAVLMASLPITAVLSTDASTAPSVVLVAVTISILVGVPLLTAALLGSLLVSYRRRDYRADSDTTTAPHQNK